LTINSVHCTTQHTIHLSKIETNIPFSCPELPVGNSR